MIVSVSQLVPLTVIALTARNYEIRLSGWGKGVGGKSRRRWREKRAKGAGKWRAGARARKEEVKAIISSDDMMLPHIWYRVVSGNVEHEVSSV